MTTIALPAGFVPNYFLMRQKTVQSAHGSPYGGSEQVVDLLNDRWTISLGLAARSSDNGARFEAFFAAMRGMTNVVNLYHFRRPVPRGTMRGAPTCGAASQGAASVTLSSAGAGATLLAGDMIGISSLLFQVAADAVANGSGVMTVTLVNRLRTNISAGAAVTWDRPTRPFILASQAGQAYVPGYSEGVSADFLEDIP